MSVQSKTWIYKTSIRPIMTYVGETRADTVKTKWLFRTTEIKTIRSMNWEIEMAYRMWWDGFDTEEEHGGVM